MKYKNFEEVPVWKDSIALAVHVFEITGDSAFRGQGDIANQIQRAALSVSNNISEGFERGTTPELLQYIYYAKGSAGEVRSMCHVIERVNTFKHLRSEISNVQAAALHISRQLGGWAFSLQETDIKGSRHLTETSKQHYHQKRTASEFMKKIEKMNEQAREERKAQREKEH